jgi:hypothetical protein
MGESTNEAPLWRRAFATRAQLRADQSRAAAQLEFVEEPEQKTRHGLNTCWCGRRYKPPTITPGYCSLRCLHRSGNT